MLKNVTILFSILFFVGCQFENVGADYTPDPNNNVANRPNIELTLPSQISEDGTITLTVVARSPSGIEKVDFYRNDSQTPFATVTEGQNHTYTAVWQATQYDEVEQTFKAIYTDNSGEVLASQNESITIASEAGKDNHRPSAQLVYSPQNPSENDIIEFIANVSDLDGSLDIDRVEFFIDNIDTPVFVDNQAPYVYEQTLSKSTHAIWAAVYDKSESSDTSSIVTIDVVTQSQNQIDNAVQLSANDLNPVDASTVSLTTQAGLEIVSVEYFVNGQSIGTDNTPVASNSAQQFSMDWTATPGTHLVLAKAANSAQQIFESETIVVATQIENTFSASVDSMNVNESLQLIFSANAEDEINLVEFYVGESQETASLHSATSMKPYSATWTASRGGNFSFYAVASYGVKDNKGVTYSTTSEIANVQVLDSSPIVMLSSDKDSAQVGDSITFTAQALDGNGTISKVEFYANSSSFATKTTHNNNSYTANYIVPELQNLPVEQHFTVIAFDNENNQTTSAAVVITIEAPISMNSRPEITLTASDNQPALGDDVTLTALVSDADGDADIAKVEFFVNGQLMSADDTAPYNYTMTNISSGNHVATAKVYDMAGENQTSSSLNINTVDGMNDVPVVSLSASQQMVVVDDVVNLTASATDSDGVASVAFYINDTLVHTDNTTPYSYAWSATEGVHSVYVIATDSNINPATNQSAAMSITVSQQAGVTPVTAYGPWLSGGNGTFISPSSGSAYTIINEGGVDVAKLKGDINAGAWLEMYTYADPNQASELGGTDISGGDFIEVTYKANVASVMQFRRTDYPVNNECHGGDHATMTLPATNGSFVTLRYTWDQFTGSVTADPSKLCKFNFAMIGSGANSELIIKNINIDGYTPPAKQ